jgi:hypothetical protein|tara:strand:+ start:3825 stop:4238 length:414 start_codon:yes stop_codon:yes gene_type:complete
VQTVDISSSPPGAAIQVNGKPIGQTPLQIDLKTKRSYTVVVEKEGYRPSDTLLAARELPDAPYLQFGLKADAGHYRRLAPAPMHIELISEIVPESVGSDRFDELGTHIEQLDTLLATAKITAAEHARIMEQILAVFE